VELTAGMRQTAEKAQWWYEPGMWGAVTHTPTHWFLQWKSTFLSLKHGVTCTQWDYMLLLSFRWRQSLIHTRKERKITNVKYVFISQSVLQDNIDVTWAKPLV